MKNGCGVSTGLKDVFSTVLRVAVGEAARIWNGALEIFIERPVGIVVHSAASHLKCYHGQQEISFEVSTSMGHFYKSRLDLIVINRLD